MANFCRVCSKQMFGDNCEADYDFEEIAATMEEGDEYPILCEGCGAERLKLMEKRKLFIQYSNNSEWVKHSDSETLNRFEENLSN